MVALRVRANVDADGKLILQLPADFAGEEVELNIEVAKPAQETWSEAELQSFLKELDAIKPTKSGADIVAWLHTQPAWEGPPLPDGAEWVEEQRRKRQERSQWSAD